MKVFQIVLPFNDEHNQPCPRRHQEWQALVLNLTGGYTRQDGAYGYWRDPDGTIIADQNVIYTVACSWVIFRKIMGQTFHIFHDQKAIFWAEIGTATIEYRP
jgi:hypothetical protein